LRNDGGEREPRVHGAASCTGVVKIYWTGTGEVTALKGIDATFLGGHVTSVVGPSGSGKSSLLRVLALIDRPTAGQVRLGDRDVSALGPATRRRLRRRLVGYVFQRPVHNVVPYLTVSQHLDYFAALRGGASKGEAEELLETLGLTGRARHRPQQLSGGEQQRLAFASAVIGGPAVVVADEPTAELDSESAGLLMERVHRLKDRGAAFVLSTHDPVVVHSSDRVLSLRHGALESETKESRALSIIDAAGRIQLPPSALRMFPDRRAVIDVEGREVRITPP
jgi:putative ABC transport system ATP-binding protein